MKKYSIGQLGEVFAEDLRLMKQSIPEVVRNATKAHTARLNAELASIRPSSVGPIVATAKGDVTVLQDSVSPSLLPDPLPQLVAAVAPYVSVTDNIYSLVYRTAKKLGIDSNIVRAHLRSVIDAAKYAEQAQKRADRVVTQSEGATTTQMADELLRKLSR